MKLLPAPKKPVYLDIREEPDAVINECFRNVKAKIARDGGDLQFGWTVWEWPGCFVEGEFHAVWKSPEGELVDITPKMTRERRILFVPDTRTVFDGIPVANIRQPLSDSPKVLRFIADANRRDKLRIKYWDGECARVPMEELINTLTPGFETWKNPGRNDPCLCGSGKKWKKCHGAES